MPKQSVYLSSEQEQQWRESGLPLSDILRLGFAKLAEEQPVIVQDKVRGRIDCKHPPARVHKGLCGACGRNVR